MVILDQSGALVGGYPQWWVPGRTNKKGVSLPMTTVVSPVHSVRKAVAMVLLLAMLLVATVLVARSAPSVELAQPDTVVMKVN